MRRPITILLAVLLVAYASVVAWAVHGAVGYRKAPGHGSLFVQHRAAGIFPQDALAIAIVLSADPRLTA